MFTVLSTPVKPLPWTTGGRAPEIATSIRSWSTAAVGSSGLPRPRRVRARARCVGDESRGGALPRPRRRRRRAMVRRPADAHVERSLVGRLVRRRDRDRARRSRASRWSSCAWHRCWPQCGADRRDHARRGGRVPRRHVLREPEPARGAPAREPHQLRQLPLRPHRGFGRALRIARDRRVVADPESPVAPDLPRPRRRRADRRGHVPRVPRDAQRHRRRVRCPARRGLRRGRIRRRPGRDGRRAHERRVERAARITASNSRRRSDDLGRGGGARGQDARRWPDRSCAACWPTPASATRSGSRWRRASTRPKCVQRALGDGADLLLVWGGDGMVQRCIDAVGDAPVPLAILPAGTGNLLARNLGIPIDLRGRGRRRRCTAPAARSTSVASTASGSR